MEKEIKKVLEDRNKTYFSQLIPFEGNCKTMEGEMLRAINRIIYRHYNDGDYFFEGYGCETAGPAHAFLTTGCPLRAQLEPLFDKAIDYRDKYEEVAYKALEIILDYIDSKEGQYEATDLDMLKFESLFEEEYEEICYGCGEEEQWCSCYEDEDDDDEY